MERMTKKEQLAGYTVNYIGEDDCFDVWSVPKKFMGNAVDRLAAIEDILGNEYDLDRLLELVQADREGRCFIGPFVAMIEQSLSGGEMKPQRDQRFNGRYAVVYFDPKKWSSPLIDICGTPYNREEAEERMKVLKAALRREQDG